eukprot:gene19629-23475_t
MGQGGGERRAWKGELRRRQEGEEEAEEEETVMEQAVDMQQEAKKEEPIIDMPGEERREEQNVRGEDDEDSNVEEDADADEEGWKKSQFLGVHWCWSGRWAAWYGSEPLGHFTRETAAARAYDKVAWETWGTEAALNFQRAHQRTCDQHVRCCEQMHRAAGSSECDRRAQKRPMGAPASTRGDDARVDRLEAGTVLQLPEANSNTHRSFSDQQSG